MQIPEIRKEGKNAVQFAEKLRKGMGTSGVMLTEDEEFSALKGAKEFFEKEFQCDVEIVKARESKSVRALKAEPGKPGIEVL